MSPCWGRLLPGHLVCQRAVGSILARRARTKIKRESPLNSETRFLSETESDGFDVKAFKEILRLRKQDKDERDEHESFVDLYLSAMEAADPVQAKVA